MEKDEQFNDYQCQEIMLKRAPPATAQASEVPNDGRQHQT